MTARRRRVRRQKPNLYNSPYDKDYYNNQQCSHAENTNSKPEVMKRPFLDAVILISISQLRNYAEQIERRLRNLNMTIEIRNMPDSLPQNKVIARVTKEGVLYAIIVNSQNEAHQTLTLHIFQGTLQEHRNMPSDDAMNLVARNFEHYLQILKEKNAGDTSTTAPPPPPPSSTAQSMAPPQTATKPSTHPPPNPDPTSSNQQSLPFLPPSSEISNILHLLAYGHHVTLEELDKVFDYLKERKCQLLEMLHSSTSKGADDFSTGDNLKGMDKNNLVSPVPPIVDFQSQSMIMPDNLHSESVNNSNMPTLINFNHPVVQKAVDNLIQSRPSHLQNINAISKDTDTQDFPTNPSMDRNHVNYNQCNIPISVDSSDSEMMPHTKKKNRRRRRVRRWYGNSHLNMDMNTGMHINPTDQPPPFYRGSDIFQNNPHMMNREPPGQMSGSHYADY